MGSVAVEAQYRQDHVMLESSGFWGKDSIKSRTQILGISRSENLSHSASYILPAFIGKRDHSVFDGI